MNTPYAGGCYGGCGGWGWRKLQGNETAQQPGGDQTAHVNATRAGEQPASNETALARPGEERRPPNASVTSEEQHQPGNATAVVPANHTHQAQASKDGECVIDCPGSTWVDGMTLC